MDLDTVVVQFRASVEGEYVFEEYILTEDDLIDYPIESRIKRFAERLPKGFGDVVEYRFIDSDGDDGGGWGQYTIPKPIQFETVGGSGKYPEGPDSRGILKIRYRHYAHVDGMREETRIKRGAIVGFEDESQIPLLLTEAMTVEWNGEGVMDYQTIIDGEHSEWSIFLQNEEMVGPYRVYNPDR